MACGFGACYGCAVELDGRLQRLCVEGPVVAAERIAMSDVAGGARARAPGAQRRRARSTRVAALDGARRRDARLRGPRHEDHHARAAAGQPAAAHRRGAGGPRQLDRPARARASTAFRASVLPRLAELVDVPLIVSVGGFAHGRLRARGRASWTARRRSRRSSSTCRARTSRAGCASIGFDPRETEAVRVRLPDADRPAAAGEARRRPRACCPTWPAPPRRRAPARWSWATRCRGTVVARGQGRSLLGGGGGGLSGPGHPPGDAARRCSSAARRSRSTSSAWAAWRRRATRCDLLDAGASRGRRRHGDLPRSAHAGPGARRPRGAGRGAGRRVASGATAISSGVGARVPEGAVTLYWSLISIMAKGRLSG